MKNIAKLLTLLVIAFYTTTSLSEPVSPQKINTMIANLTAKTAQLETLAIQPIFSEIPTADLNTFKSSVVRDIQNIRNDIKKMITFLQTLSNNQQETLRAMVQ